MASISKIQFKGIFHASNVLLLMPDRSLYPFKLPFRFPLHTARPCQEPLEPKRICLNAGHMLLSCIEFLSSALIQNDPCVVDAGPQGK